MINRTLRELMDEYLMKVFNGTAHPHRVSVLDDFVQWVEGYEKFVDKCGERVNNAFGAVGLHRATNEPRTTIFGFPVVESEAVPQGVVLLGRWPTEEEIKEHGSFEAAVKALAEAGQWAKITGVATE